MAAEDVHIYVDAGATVHIHTGGGTDTTGSPELLAAIQALDGKVTAMTDAVSQVNTNLDNISADITTLTEAANNAASTNDALQQALNQALAAQDQVVADAVNAAIAQEKAANDAALADLVSKSAEIAGRTPDATTPETPTEPTPPTDQTPVDPNAPVDQTPADQTPPADTTPPADQAVDPNAPVAGDNTAGG